MRIEDAEDGRPGAGRVGHRPGLHGHERRRTASGTTPARRRPSNARSTSASTTSTRPTCTASGDNEELVGAVVGGGGTRSSSRRSSPTARDADGRPFVDSSGGVGAGGLRRLAVAARDRHDRPVLHAPPRPGDPDRGDGGRDGGPGDRRQGPAHRPVRGQRGDPAGGARRTPDRGRAAGVLAVRRGTPSRARCCATCRELGVAVVAYSPVGRGLLTGTFTSRSDLPAGDFRRVAPRFSDENMTVNPKLVEQVSAVAAEIGCTPAQARAGLAARPGRRHPPDPRDQAGAVPGGERGGGRHRADAGAGRGPHDGGAFRGGGRRALPGRGMRHLGH